MGRSFDISTVEGIDKAIKALKNLREVKLQERKDASREHMAGVYGETVYTNRKKLIVDLEIDGFRYLARDKNGELYAYRSLPRKEILNVWRSDYPGDAQYIYKDTFPTVQWTDEEPTELHSFAVSELLAHNGIVPNNGKPLEDVSVEYEGTKFNWWNNSLRLHGVKIPDADKDLALKIEQGAYELKLVERGK